MLNYLSTKLLSSHSSPVFPGTQSHLKVFIKLTQVLLILHGFEEHSFMVSKI